MTTFPLCPICESPNFTAHSVKEMMYGTGETFEYLECSGCHSLRIAEIPSDLSRFYPNSSYYSFNGNHDSGRLKRFIDSRRVQDRFGSSFVRKYRPDYTMQALAPLKSGSRSSSRVLDVGCGSGEIVLRLMSIHIEAMGIDPFLTGKESAFVKRWSIFDMSEKWELWDVILMSHSLEHMPNQLEVLAKAKRLLRVNPKTQKIGGRIVVRIPVASWAWRNYKTNWVELDAPRHLFIHSYQSFNLACEKSGLKIDRVIHDSEAFEHVASQQIAKGIPLREQHYTRAELKSGSRIAADLNAKGESGRASFILKTI